MKRILFVDTFNALHSPIAEAWFNRYTQGCGIASSCGIKPAEWIDARAIQAMARVGIEIGHKPPRQLSRRLLAQADIVVLIGVDLDLVTDATVQFWQMKDLVDPSADPVSELHMQIRQRVIRLIAEIQQDPASKNFSEYQWQTAVQSLSAL